MQQKQGKKFNILGFRLKALVNFTFDLDIPKSNPYGEKKKPKEFGGLVYPNLPLYSKMWPLRERKI